jgi:hypothetical protein
LCIALAVSFCAAVPLSAQTGATVGVGGSMVEYQGFLPSGAATLSAGLRHESAKMSLGAQGSWTVFESGNPIIQATGAAAWLTQPSTRWGFELGGVAGLSRYASEPGVGHILLRGRAHYIAERAGSWLNLTTGASLGGTAATPVEFSFGAWSSHQNISLVGNVTSTWLEGQHILDLEGAARWSSQRFELEARAGTRAAGAGVLEDGTAESRTWAEASAIMRIAPRFSFLLSGGSYPSDPVRRALGAKYASAGIRLAFAGADRSEPMTVPAQLLAAVRAHEKASTSPAARLEIERTGEKHLLRVHATTANKIDVMGDFTDWEARSLTKTADGVWEIEIALAAGVHRLNIRIDDGEWLVPAGARPEQGDFGGMVGVVVIR